METVGVSPGSSLGDRYTLERRLGAGGMASVWLADDRLLARRVAVKLIADTLSSDEHYRTRFAREAQAAASVSHANIVPVYDYGLHDERPFLVMEYVPGGSLADGFAGRRSILPQPADLAAELLGALDCVHGVGLVHRDVKPANILLDAGGHARLTDFGIAQPADAASLTQTGMVVGSIRYLAPEVAAGDRASAASDLYAVGVVLRELTDRTPASELSPLIAALTAPRPQDRPASARSASLLLAAEPAETDESIAPTLLAPAPPRAPAVQRTPRTPQPAAQTQARPRRPISGARRWRLSAPRIRLSRPALAVAGVVMVVVVVVLIAARGGGSPARATAAPSAVAPAGASLSDQLSSLRRIVAGAAKS
jgi:serine/threonine protein kinase